jgi:hypothetical protein
MLVRPPRASLTTVLASQIDLRKATMFFHTKELRGSVKAGFGWPNIDRLSIAASIWLCGYHWDAGQRRSSPNAVTPVATLPGETYGGQRKRLPLEFAAGRYGLKAYSILPLPNDPDKH